MNRQTLLVVVLLGLVLVPVFGAASGQSDGGDVDKENVSTAPTDVDSPSDYSLQELRRGGEVDADSPDPSSRIDARDNTYAFRYYQTYPWVTNDPLEENSWWDFLTPGSTVHRNSVWMNTYRSEDRSVEQTMKIVSWTEGTQKRSTPNGTVTETVATNVSVSTVNYRLEPNYDWTKIRLPRHPEKRQITMWVEGQGDTLRWRFQHESSAVTKAVPVQNWGGRLYWAGTNLLIPILIGGLLVSWVLQVLLDRAVVGPNKGRGFWGFWLGLGVAVAVFVAWDNLTSLFVAAPFIMDAFIVGVIGIQVLEGHNAPTFKARFFKPEIVQGVDLRDLDTEERDPDSEGIEYAKTMRYADDVEKKVVRTNDGDLMVYEKGVGPFAARAFGARCVLEQEAIQTRLTLGDESECDEMFIVHPESEEIIEHEPEGFQFDPPELTLEQLQEQGEAWNLAMVGGAGVLAGALVQNVYGAGGVAVGVLAGGTALAGMYLRPTGGVADIVPAPIHYRNVMATSIIVNRGFSEAETIEELSAKIAEQEAKGARERVQFRDRRDATLASRIHEERGAKDADRLLDDVSEEEEDVDVTRKNGEPGEGEEAARDASKRGDD